MNNHRVKLTFCVIWLCSLILSGCGKNQNMESAKKMSEADKVMAVLETHYCTLQYPEEFVGTLLHKEVVEGSEAIEIFSMMNGEAELELFRLYFGSARIGEQIGFLKTQWGETSVSYTVCEYEDSEFTDENTKSQYYQLMDVLNDLLKSVQNGSTFSISGTVPDLGRRDAKLKYWTISVLENMYWEETVSENAYQVSFKGNIDSRQIEIYSISIGAVAYENVLGSWELNGSCLPVSVRTFENVVDASWTEEEINTYYNMLDTLNEAIQVIISCENFAEENQG